MTQLTFTYDEMLQALITYEKEAIAAYPHRKQLIQMTVLAMQDFMQSDHMRPFRDDQRQTSLPGLLQVPTSIDNGTIHVDSELDVTNNALPDTPPTMLNFEVTYYSDNSDPKTDIIKSESLATAESLANQKCNVLLGQWCSVRCLDKPKRTLPPIQEKLDL